MPNSASRVSPMSVNAADFPDSTVSAEDRCSYRSKPCDNKRAIKVNGEMHKLCDYHRKRANINQQRVHLRRRLSKKQAQELELKYGPMSGDEEAIEFEPSTAPCGDLTYTELQILKLLLSDDPADVERIANANYHSPTMHLSV
ncbi:hypothetical protein FI667_g7494, partial [Globisporangium splendens]